MDGRGNLRRGTRKDRILLGCVCFYYPVQLCQALLLLLCCCCCGAVAGSCQGFNPVARGTQKQSTADILPAGEPALIVFLCSALRACDAGAVAAIPVPHVARNGKKLSLLRSNDLLLPVIWLLPSDVPAFSPVHAADEMRAAGAGARSAHDQH